MLNNIKSKTKEIINDFFFIVKVFINEFGAEIFTIIVSIMVALMLLRLFLLK